MKQGDNPEIQRVWGAFKLMQQGNGSQYQHDALWHALMEWHVSKERQGVRQQAWQDAEADKENGYRITQRAMERAQERVGEANEDWQDFYVLCYLQHHHHISQWGYKGDVPDVSTEKEQDDE